MKQMMLLLVACLMLTTCTDERRNLPVPEDPVVSRDPRPDSRPECDLGDEIARVRRGYVPGRGQDISLLPREPNYIGAATKPVHTGPWDYLAEVPLVFYGPELIPAAGEIERPVTLADLTPTFAEMLGTTPPSHAEGHPIDEVTEAMDPRKPRLIVTVVWDGGGMNVLREHPDDWPFLERIMEDGSSFVSAEIGSTPSNTPPIHTTIGTGAFPRTHGIAAVKMRTASDGYIDPYEGNNGDRIRVATLADLYDLRENNEPLVGVVATVNWHLGMIGKGAHHPGADRDIALLMDDEGEPYGDATAYDVPASTGASLEERAGVLDAGDGSQDGRWLDRDLSDPAIRYASPAYVDYQKQVLEQLITERGFGADATPDLLYTNFKSIDDAGHRWGMTSDETAAVLAATDSALRSLVRLLDDSVGEGRWVLALTADHGQTPFPEESGAWPIGGGELRDDANRALDDTDDAVDLVTRVTSAGAFLSSDQLQANDLQTADVAEWMAGYTVAENVRNGEDLPAGWSDRGSEPLFDAAIAGKARPFLSCTPAS